MGKIEIDKTAVLGQPLRPLQGMVLSTENPSNKEVLIEGDLYVGPYSVIGEGVRLADGVIT